MIQGTRSIPTTGAEQRSADPSKRAQEIVSDAVQKSDGDASESNQEQVEALREAANRFESMFLKLMLKKMREAMPESSEMFSGGKGEDIFQSRLDEQFAEKTAHSESGLGISEMVFDSLKDAVNRTKAKVAQSGSQTNPS